MGPLDGAHVRQSEGSQSSGSILARKKIQNIIILAVLGIFVCCWLVWICCGKYLWALSITVEENLSRWPHFFYYWFWVFSNPIFTAKIFMVGLLLLMAPKKESALKSITVMLISHCLRQYIRAAVKEPRPIFQKSKIHRHSPCSCSFGFPSGHSEGSTLFYGLLVYELILQNPRLSKRTKTIWIVVAAVIVMNVMVSRLYFGKHSLPQVFIGALQGLSAISLMILFGKQLDAIFRELLQGNRKIMLYLVSISALVSVANFVMYNSYFDHQLETYTKISPVNCKYCFKDGLLRMRKSTAVAFQYPSLAVGLFWGIYKLNPYYTASNSDTVETHLSQTGLLRMLVLLEVHLPLLLLRLTRTAGLSPFLVSSVSVGTFLLLGVSLGYVLTKQLYGFGLAIEGDIKPRPQGSEGVDRTGDDWEERKTLI